MQTDTDIVLCPTPEYDLAGSFCRCEDIARREAGNFYHAFRLLPRPQRRAMSVLYAFLRLTDDLGDGPDPVETKRAQLTDWRLRFQRALAGEPSHAIHPALAQVVADFRIPREHLEEVLDGVEMDLDVNRYRTFDDLYGYCHHVASAVGLACIHIWGFRDDAAKDFAERAGIAFQLTNILRDLGEDASRGRIYLPQEDLDRFGVTESQLMDGVRNEAFRDLMRFETERAREFYISSEPLSDLLAAPGKAVFLVLSRTYRALLEKIEREDFDVFARRIGVSRWRKMALVLRAMPVRFGWTK